MTEFNHLNIFHLNFGVDGISLYFLVRPLINDKPGPLRPADGSTLHKPTDLSDSEIDRGVKHVSKACIAVSYEPKKGKVTFYHVIIVIPARDYRLYSKVTDANRKRKCKEI